MEYDSKYYDNKWTEIIKQMPKGGQYRFDLSKHSYNIISDHIGTGKKVFDYACGLGVLGQYLHTTDLYGCDFSQVAVDYASQYGNFKTTGEIFGDKYDYVIASYFLEHIKDPVKWVNDSLDKAKSVICSIPDNLRQQGEHSDMQWNSWDSFNELFKDFKVKQIDIKDDVSLYPNELPHAFKHPIMEFTK